MSILQVAIQAKEASVKLQGLSEEMRLTALDAIAKALLAHQKEIITENKKVYDFNFQSCAFSFVSGSVSFVFLEYLKKIF